MQRQFLSAKIHRAVVTGADLNYVGSITIDPVLMEAAGILPWEWVQVVDIDNGARFETYAIPGERGSGDVQLNGAAARLVQRGDHIIIMTYVCINADELANHHPVVVFVDERNQVTRVTTLPSPIEPWVPEDG
jgi:aspartate 1-decarboxylase